MDHQQETNRMHNPSTCPNRRTFLATDAIGAAAFTTHSASTPLVAADSPNPIERLTTVRKQMERALGIS